MDALDLLPDIELIDLIPLIAIAAVESAPERSNTPITSGDGILSGSDYLSELLSCGDEKRIYTALRMR